MVYICRMKINLLKDNPNLKYKNFEEEYYKKLTKYNFIFIRKIIRWITFFGNCQSNLIFWFFFHEYRNRINAIIIVLKCFFCSNLDPKRYFLALKIWRQHDYVEREKGCFFTSLKNHIIASLFYPKLWTILSNVTESLVYDILSLDYYLD